MRILAKNLYWYDYLDAKEMDIIFKGGQISGKEKVRQYTFETDIEERNLEENEKVLEQPVEQPLRTVETSKPDSKDEKADEKTPKKPGSDDGSDGGPGGERLIPESILPGRDENSAPQ